MLNPANNAAYWKGLEKMAGVARGTKRPSSETDGCKRARLNQLAHVGDCELHPRVFQHLVKRMGTPSIDVFASD